jgi:hypothetical protein
MIQTAPWPKDLVEAVAELRHFPGWLFTLVEEDRGQGCSGLTLSIYPDHADSYHPENPVRTRFLYSVPAAAYNRESWDEWLWQCLVETDDHERAENFRFVTPDKPEGRRPFKPAHTDGWNPGVVRTVVSETVANTPNAGRLVKVPCPNCPHLHSGRFGEHFTVEHVYACSDEGCACTFGKG